MASVAAQGAPIVVQSVPPPPHPGVKYANTYKNLGITQLILGSVSLILGIASLSIGIQTDYYGFSFISTGLWCGFLMLAAGAAGIASGKNPSSCPITAGLILTIIASIAAGIMMAIEIPAAITLSWANGYSYQEVRRAIHSLLAIIAFGELVVAIIHSAYCCTVTCCYTYSGAVLSHGQRTVVATTTTHPMPVTSIPGQQIQYGYPPQQYFVQGAVAPSVQQTFPQGYQPPPVYQQVTEPMLPSYSQASSQPADQQFQPPGYSEKQPLHQ